MTPQRVKVLWNEDGTVGIDAWCTDEDGRNRAAIRRSADLTTVIAGGPHQVATLEDLVELLHATAMQLAAEDEAAEQAGNLL